MAVVSSADQLANETSPLFKVVSVTLSMDDYDLVFFHRHAENISFIALFAGTSLGAL
jgi:hypothetical protein